MHKEGECQAYDICPLMDEFQVGFKETIHDRSSFQFDEKMFNGASSHTVDGMKVYLRTVCRDAGFDVLCIKNSTFKKQRGKLLASVGFRCRHGEVQKKRIVVEDNSAVSTSADSVKPKRTHLTTFHSSTVEETCPFFLKVFCSSRDGLWYLSYSRKVEKLSPSELGPPQPCLHCNHLQMNASQVKISLQEIRYHCEDLLVACAEADVTAAVKKNLMKIYGKFGHGAISTHQMTYFQACHDDLTAVVGSITGTMSSAEKVLKVMDALVENGDDLDYCALIHQSGHDYKIRMPKGRPTKTLNDVNEDRKNTIKNIRKSLKISDGTEVLLAIAWVSGEEKELFHRFPTVISADITEKLNREKRPTFIFVGADGNNKLFPCFRCFLPNSSLEMFNWCYEKAFSILMKKEDVLLNKVFLTDGEFNMYYAMDLASSVNTYWKNTVTYRCRFHLFYQPWKKKVSGKPKKGSDEETICSWIYNYFEYMMYNVLYEYQLDICIEDFEMNLVKEFKRIPKTHNAIDHLWKSMKACRSKWARCYRSNRMDLELGTTSPSESFNASLKVVTGKKRLAKSNIGSSAKLMIAHSSALLERREE